MKMLHGCHAAVLAMALLGVALVVSGCSDGDSPVPGQEALVLRLAADEACYGVVVDVDQAELSEEERASSDNCTLDPALLEQGCTLDVSSTPSRLSLSARGCFVQDGSPLFDCTVPERLASRIRTTAETRCGCGCADRCPTAVTTAVCGTGDRDCLENFPESTPDEGDPVGAFGAVERTVSSAQATAITSTTNFCGTCCDVYGVETGVEIREEVAVSEIRFELTMPLEYPFCPEILECSTASIFDGPAFVRERGDSLSVCLSAKGAVQGPVHLLSCSVISDGTERWNVSDIAALDDRLKSHTPAPIVLNQ